MINYGIVYGLSAYGMADRLDIPQEEADEFIQRYLEGFPAVARFIDETIEQGTEHGYVSTLFGRRRQVPELRARRWEMRKQGERFAVNMVIQGTAADIIKVAMVRAHAALATEAGCGPARPPDPRRAAVRGTRLRRPSRSSDRDSRDGSGLRDGSAAGGRRRRRQRLADRQVRNDAGTSRGQDGAGVTAREGRMRDLQVVVERPLDESPVAHRPQRRPEHAGRDARDQPLDCGASIRTSSGARR